MSHSLNFGKFTTHIYSEADLEWVYECYKLVSWKKGSSNYVKNVQYKNNTKVMKKTGYVIQGTKNFCQLFAQLRKLGRDNKHQTHSLKEIYL